MTIVQRGPLPAGNFWQGREGQPPNKILLHTMTCWIAQADARFHNPTAYVSAHFGVRVDGDLWQWVQVWDTAYHAGDWTVNLDSIGIENEDGGDFNGVRPDALYARSAALVAQFCKEYTIPCVRGQKAADGTFPPGIYDHRQVHATACPDALDTDRIIAAAAAILAHTPEPVLTPTLPTPTPAPASPIESHAVLLASMPQIDVVHEWASLYKQEGPRAEIRPEIALAQALHETGRFTFPGDVPAAYNNPAGLGATGGPGVGNVFPTKRAGVIAHFQHLLMYYRGAHTWYCTPPTIDQRHYAHRGYPDDVDQLTGHWAVPGVNPVTGETYAQAILKLVPEARQLLAES